MRHNGSVGSVDRGEKSQSLRLLLDELARSNIFGDVHADLSGQPRRSEKYRGA